MRYGLFLVACFFVANASLAQETGPTSGGPATPAAAAAVQSYTVQLTEFRLKSTSDPKLSASELVASFEQMKKDGKLDLVETIRLSALEQYESMAQFGRRAAVTVGVTVGGANGPVGRPTTRSIQHQMVGTTVRLTATPQQGKILLKLSYETARLEEEAKDAISPDTRMVQFNTTLLIEPGKPTLVGGSSAENSSYLLVSIGK